VHFTQLPQPLQSYEVSLRAQRRLLPVLISDEKPHGLDYS
jgi:hypothetical protein